VEARTARHTVQVEADSEPLVGDWDAGRLGRALANLLSNATKYSPDGGEVVVGLAREQGAGGAWAVLRVRDRGIGIPAADLPHVFEPFYRAANAVAQAGGAGIGLAGARQIVEQHGGMIDVESRDGEGTTVTVRLPLDGATDAAA
jgi:signal transduction histidine kinase